jgi:hypothetical protein
MKGVLTIELEINVLNLVVLKFLLVELIDAIYTVELEDVMNQIVTNLLWVRHTSASLTVVVSDVQIVLTGLIRGVVHLSTMDIV